MTLFAIVDRAFDIDDFECSSFKILKIAPSRECAEKYIRGMEAKDITFEGGYAAHDEIVKDSKTRSIKRLIKEECGRSSDDWKHMICMEEVECTM